MTVCIVAIEESSLPGVADAAITYDVAAQIDAQEYAFRASIVLSNIGRHVVQSASFCDENYSDVLRWHQTVLTKMGKLVLSFYNNEPLTFPICLDES